MEKNSTEATILNDRDGGDVGGIDYTNDYGNEHSGGMDTIAADTLEWWR